MARLVARIKLLPTDIKVNLDSVVNKLKSSLPDGMEIKNSAEEPIAFGLNALIVDFLIDDKEGQMDKLESMVKDTEGVSEIQVVHVSRQVSSLG
ncbi:MAG: elongation factor 1-beta [Nitrososphaerales archaeon]